MKFKDIPGNESVKQALVRMVDANRMPHALLLYENEGCGALSLSLALFQYINCKNRVDGDSCGVCPTCNKIQKLIHPDLHFVYPTNTGSKISSSSKPTSESYIKYWRELVLADPYFLETELYQALGIEKKAGNIAVAEAKSILEKLSLTSMENGYKAVVIWLPEKMNAEAANKLLKIIEEPPAMTLFLLVTHAPEKVLQTIFSRCQSLRVLPIAKEDVAITLENQFSVPREQALMHASTSSGSIGVALSQIGDREEYSTFMDLFQRIVNACLSKDLLSALDAGEEVAALSTREKQKGFCTFTADCLRKIFMLRGTLTDIANIPADEMAFFSTVAPRVKEGFCQKTITYLDNAAMLIERNVNPKIVFCDLIDRIYVSI